MKNFLITEEDKKYIKKLHNLVEIDSAKAISALAQFVNKSKSSQSQDSSTSQDSSDTAPIDSDYTANELNVNFISPLKNVPVPKGDYGRVRAGLDTAGKPHLGVDMGAQSGTKVHAPADGLVSDAAIRENGCGGTLAIEHKDGYKSRYCHLRKINVKIGDTVKQGQVVALTGGGANEPGHGFSTGPHLHFEMYRNGAIIDPASVYSSIQKR